jgi:hypothetical protein
VREDFDIIVSIHKGKATVDVWQREGPSPYVEPGDLPQLARWLETAAALAEQSAWATV